jgi:hypothetical protein
MSTRPAVDAVPRVRVRSVRRFYRGGAEVQIGEMLDLDPIEAGELIYGGKVAPADKAAAGFARLPHAWHAPSEPIDRAAYARWPQAQSPSVYGLRRR